MFRNKKIAVGLVLAFYLGTVFIQTGLWVNHANAFSLSTNNFSFYPGNPGSLEDKQTVNEAFSSNGNDYGESAWNIFEVYVKDFPSLGSFTIPYSQGDSESQNCHGAIGSVAQGCERRQPVFAFAYYCSMPGGKISANKPPDTVDHYYLINYGIKLYDNNGSEGEQFMVRDGYDSHGLMLNAKLFDSSSPEGKDVGPYGARMDSACQPPSFDMKGPSGQMKNFNKLTAAQKKAFEEAKTKTINGTKTGQEDSDSCVTLDSGPLGWIICPIIDLTSTFSQGVFTNFVQPFLEDVPISTDPSDGAYLAWKQFRLIGNIILVGTMLVVVYAQIKGDR